MTGPRPTLRILLAAVLAAGCASALAAGPADWCRRLAPRLPGVSEARCEQADLVPTGAMSTRGFPLLARSIPAAVRKSGDKPIRILLLGAIHGDELTAAAIVFDWMQWMKATPARDFEWVIAPVVNPDGLLARTPQRVNANGVDLNRNFPTPDWERDADHYWRVRTGRNARRFPGHTPLSEPETKWLYGEIERFEPDVIVSVHAPFGILDFDGPAPKPRKFGRLWFRPLGVYPGSLGNYGGVHKNVPVITIELPNARRMPFAAEEKRIWQDMMKWIAGNVSHKDQQADASDADPPASGAAHRQPQATLPSSG